MKVVQFASSSTWTGEMAHVFSLSRSLANRGAEITLAFRTIRKGKGIPLPGEKATEFGFSSVLALNLDSGFYPFQMVSDLRKLIRHIDREGIQVLHTHRGQDHWLAVVASKLSSRKPHVVRTRHVAVALRTHILNRWLFEQTDQVLVTAEAILDQFQTAPFKLKRPVRLFHGGVDCEKFTPGRTGAGIRAEFAVGEEDCLICAVGHLARVKGYETLLEALELARRANPAIKCLIVGMGSEEYRSSLQEQIEQLGLQEAVTLTGFRSDVAEIMAASNFGVLSSVSSEGNSRTALELMACGLAIVATSVGCLPDLVLDNETGYIIPPGDPASMAEKILVLSEHPALGAAMGEKGRERVLANYSEQTVAEEMEMLYREIIGL